MLLTTTRFNEINVKDEDIIHFPEGILGFQNLKRFVWQEVEGNPLFRWLQAVDDGEIAFLLVDPFMLVPGYELEIKENVQEKLKIDKPEDVLIYTTVTIPLEGVAKATTNLVGPLVFNLKTKRGYQVVLEGVKYGVKHPLFVSPQEYNSTTAEGK